MKGLFIVLGIIFAIIISWFLYQKFNVNGKYYCPTGSYSWKLSRCIEVTPTSAVLTVV